jgi:hypothetical protein
VKQKKTLPAQSARSCQEFALCEKQELIQRRHFAIRARMKQYPASKAMLKLKFGKIELFPKINFACELG